MLAARITIPVDGVCFTASTARKLADCKTLASKAFLQLRAKTLLRKTIPVARRVLGEGALITLSMRGIYGQSLYGDNGATLDDLREAVTTFEDTSRIARRVFGSAHPTTAEIEECLGYARAALRARETPPESS